MHQYASLISYNIYFEIFNTGCPEKISTLCYFCANQCWKFEHVQ